MRRCLLLLVVLGLLWGEEAAAQTRFYFPLTTASAISPTADAGWQNTANRVYRVLVTTKLAEGQGDHTFTETATDPELTVLRQYIKCGLEAQTIDGSLKGQILARESDAALNSRLAIGIRVLSGDGVSVRGTVLAITRTDANATPPEFAVGVNGVNRQFQDLSESTPITLSAVVAQAGDCLEVAVGVWDSGNGTTATMTLRFGDNAGANDLAEDQTSSQGTTDYNPWVEFSDTITFQAAGASRPCIIGGGMIGPGCSGE